MGKNEGVAVIAIGVLIALFGPAMTAGAEGPRAVGVVIALAGVIVLLRAYLRDGAAQRQDSTR